MHFILVINDIQHQIIGKISIAIARNETAFAVKKFYVMSK